MHRFLQQMMAGQPQRSEGASKEQGPERRSNADWNHQTNPNEGIQNNLIIRIQDAKKSQFKKQPSAMEQKQMAIKHRLLQRKAAQDNKLKELEVDFKDGSEIKQTQKEEFARALLKNRKKELIVPSTTYLQQESANIYQNLIPNSLYQSHTVSDSRVYGGRFTLKGNMYYCSSQSQIVLFNTQDPYKWKQVSCVEAQQVHWTVTDMDVDVNEQFLIYSTISPLVHLVDLETLCKKHERLTFQTDENYGYYGGPSLMSIKFSGDSREVLGGSKSGQILIYDMVQNRVNTVVSGAHDDEINTVCWANRETSNLLYTGSDDSFVKVWDRRALGGSRRPAGVFIGHQEGVTNVASKGDGLYLASNAKDQLLKVWDIRKMHDYDTFKNNCKPIRQARGFDYRMCRYPYAGKQTKHPQDKSIFTFQGHEVLNTLIRCQFSPIETTGQRYVYTGSANGRIHIFDLLTGGKAMVLPNKGRASGSDVNGYYNRGDSKGAPCRDVSWHPHFPVLASTSFDCSVKLWTLQNEKDLASEQSLSLSQSQENSKIKNDYSTDEEVEDEDDEDVHGEDQQEESEEEENGEEEVMAIGGTGGQSAITMNQLMQLIFRQRAAEQEDDQNYNQALQEAMANDEESESDEEDIQPFTTGPVSAVVTGQQPDPKAGDKDQQSSGSKSTGKDKMEDEDEDVEFFDMFENDKKVINNLDSDQLAKEEEKKDTWDQKIEVEQSNQQDLTKIEKIAKQEQNEDSSSDNEMHDALDKAIDQAAKEETEIDQF